MTSLEQDIFTFTNKLKVNDKASNIKSHVESCKHALMYKNGYMKRFCFTRIKVLFTDAANVNQKVVGGNELRRNWYVQ